MLTLKGRTAVITGGSRGIGFAIASELAKGGMNVGILSVHDGTAKSAAKILTEKGYICVGYQCDVADIASIKKALNYVNEFFGGIDVVVNSAGILDVFKVPSCIFVLFSPIALIP